MLDTIIIIIIIGRLATELSKWQCYNTQSTIMSHGAIITYIYTYMHKCTNYISIILVCTNINAGCAYKIMLPLYCYINNANDDLCYAILGHTCL